MNSCIYNCKLFHDRLIPKRNTFNYSIYMLYIDLDELSILEKNNHIFSYNKKNILSFNDKDHFKFLNFSNSEKIQIAQENINIDFKNYEDKNTKERIITLSKELWFDFEIKKVNIMTNLRVLGYVFNPVSFYYCFDKNNKLKVLFSEVNNTFHDQKMYYTLIENENDKIFESLQRKNYYISPFTNCENDLKWKFNIPWDNFMMSINSIKEEGIELKTLTTGKRKEISNKNLIWLQIRYPLQTLRVIFLIHYQALKLFFKKVQYFKKEETDKYIANVINNKLKK